MSSLRSAAWSLALTACATASTAELVGLPDTPDWDRGARALLLAHDADGDASLSEAEVVAVPCTLWRRLDAACRGARELGFGALYGIEPGFVFRGEPLGLTRAARDPTLRAIERCVSSDTAVEAEVELLRHLRGLDETPATRPWDEAVARLLLAAYDLDASGRLDSGREVLAMPCEVVIALEEAVLGTTNTPMLALYGFAQGYEWVGQALGFDEAMRAEAAAHLERCGLTD